MNVLELKSDNVTELRTDAQIAADIRDRGRVFLMGFAALMDEARSHGMNLSMNITTNQFGKHVVQDITLVKLL